MHCRQGLVAARVAASLFSLTQAHCMQLPTERFPGTLARQLFLFFLFDDDALTSGALPWQSIKARYFAALAA